MVGESVSQLLTGLTTQPMITTAPSSATGFQQTVAVRKAGQQLTSRIQGTLANPCRLGGIDFSVACEVVQNQKVKGSGEGVSEGVSS